MKTVADQFADILAAAGVNRVYGTVGDSLNGLTDAIRRQGKIEWLHVRHEEVAAFAAGAEAHFAREGPSASTRTTSNSPARASSISFRYPGRSWSAPLTGHG
jgi:thiamine pyrophosphate-dependent acetolactate synthase large subunit-like protein